MRNAKRLSRFVIFALALVSLTWSVVALAAPSADPDPAVNPALAALIKSGARFFYLGHYADLDGWLAVKDNQTQIIYKPTSSNYAMVGYVFSADGENVTSRQVKQLIASNKELAAMAATNDLPQPSANPVAATSPEPATNASDVLLPTGERFIKEARRSAGGLLLGKDDAALPELYVIASPGSPASKALWQAFGDAVKQGTLRLRLLPAAPRDSDAERAAAQLIHADNPLAAWDAYTNGERAVLAGVPAQPMIDQVRANASLVERWKLPQVPYLAYRGRDGQLKVVQGVPNQPKAVLDDIAVEPKP